MTTEKPGSTILDMAQARAKKRRPRGSVEHPFAEVGGRLRQGRKALTDESARAFADDLDIKPQTYRNYERGDRKLDYDTISVVAERGISPTWLFCGIKPILIPPSGRFAPLQLKLAE